MGKQQIGTMSAQALKKQYWRGAGEDLVTLGYAERVKRRKGCHQWYRILKALPRVEDFSIELGDHYTRPIIEWLDVIEEELNALKEEMEEWRDNMDGTGLESTEKYQEVEQCADELETALQDFDPELAANNPNLSGISVMVEPGALFVSCSYRAKKKRTSRYWRAQEVCNILSAIEKVVRAKKTPDKRVGEFAYLIHEVAGQVEDIDFPRAF